MSKAKRSAAAKKAARKRKRNAAADKAVNTTQISEKYCARYIERRHKNKGKSLLHGNPDITFVMNKGGKPIFYEVKPYRNKIKKTKFKWKPVGMGRQILSPDQLRIFEALIKADFKVYIIYYDLEDKKGTKKITIHQQKNKPNPRLVTLKMLQDEKKTEENHYFD